ncbi:hypothetical protein TrCOL_g1803 [Triparma columacea]|uniref:Uncharacterized protein n=1 Tax=Triparma columacea TaxID=722753 RepID=A0A9W7GG98_9STRA|nr:hypothetical protein TrCOL_g1803 [Triparma columacea]
MAPTVLVTGSVLFAILVGSLLLLTGCARGAGMLSKDDSAIASIVVSISVFCMWLLWSCSVLHQWHPLIQPLYEKME